MGHTTAMVERARTHAAAGRRVLVVVANAREKERIGRLINDSRITVQSMHVPLRGNCRWDCVEVDHYAHELFALHRQWWPPGPPWWNTLKLGAA